MEEERHIWRHRGARGQRERDCPIATTINFGMKRDSREGGRERQKDREEEWERENAISAYTREKEKDGGMEREGGQREGESEHASNCNSHKLRWVIFHSGLLHIQ